MKGVSVEEFEEAVAAVAAGALNKTWSGPVLCEQGQF